MSVNTKMTAIADAIRAKTGGTAALSLDAMAEAIAGLGSGLSDDIEEINYGTYEHASSSYTGSGYAYVEHGLSGIPHLFAAVVDMDYSASIPKIDDGTIVASVSTNPVSTSGGSIYSIGAQVYTAYDGSVNRANSNSPSETKGYLGSYIKRGAVYRWIAVRFKQNEQTL